MLVPTLFSVFPSWTDWSVLARVAIVLAWLGCAYVVVAGTAKQSEQIQDLVGEDLHRRALMRTGAVARLLESLFTPEGARIPAIYQLRLYLPDHEGVLRPEFTSAEPATEWEPGKGAVGAAWAGNSMVIARGPQTSDETHGLTPEQQERYRHLEVVVACPIQNARERPIGVVAASATEDDGYFDTQDGCDNLVALAAAAARVLLDIRGLGQD